MQSISDYQEGIPVEKKLELIRQIRLQYYQNQNDLMHRENLLYGKTSLNRKNSIADPYSAEISFDINSEKESIPRDKTLKIRYALAAVLFITVIICDKSQISLSGISMEKVFQLVEVDYEKAILALGENLIIQEKNTN